MKCPYANVVDESRIISGTHYECYCMASSNPGNKHSEYTQSGVAWNKCVESNNDAYMQCPFYKKG